MPPLVRLASRRYAGLPPFRRPQVNASALLAQSSDSFYDSLHSDLQSQYAERSGPPLFIPPAPAPMKHALDVEAAQTWVYPVNLPLRDYQFNIVRAALFRNTLAALPTGLGKTFIAGCVMLNYARWYPTAKIFFVAPTKPLVNQQAQAFPETCGFLNSKITILDGSTSATAREDVYPTKQVFFMTAQTLQNDIAKGIFDPRDAILLVVDEAHRATKNHAYAEVARMIRARNPNVRVLALTATPSSTVSGVQEVIDALGLTHIELLSETSRALIPYLHKRPTTEIKVPLSSQMVRIRNDLADMMRALTATLRTERFWSTYLSNATADPTTVNPYTFNRILLKERASQSGRRTLSLLARYAQAMEYLQLHSIGSFAQTFLEIDCSGSRHRGFLREIQQLRQVDGSFPPHPKLLALRRLLLEHFAPREPEDGRGDFDPNSTRVMVFCSYRAVTEEVVSLLAKHEPSLRPVAFIGQSGEKGLKIEQLAIIADFKAGKYNVLVATCIGEEGLDIGSVDRIFCYDVPGSSIRLLQRIGRTGRQRDGEVTVLVGEGREKDALWRANDAYTRIQREIASGDKLHFHAAPRLMPAEIEPVCERKVVPIDQAVPDLDLLSARAAAAKAEALQAKMEAKAAAMAARKQAKEEAKAATAAQKQAEKEARAATRAEAKAAAAAAKASRTKRPVKAVEAVGPVTDETELSDQSFIAARSE